MGLLNVLLELPESSERFEPVIRQTCLRIFADHLLHRRRLKSAIVCLAAARSGGAGLLFDDVRVVGRNGGVRLSETFKADEVYLPRVFQGFAHELGHHLKASTRRAAEELELLGTEALEKRIIGLVKDIRGDGTPPHPAAALPEERRRAAESMFEELVSMAGSWAGNLKREIISDLVAIRVLWAACLDLSRRHSRRKPDLARFMTQVCVGQIALLVTQLIAHSRMGDKSETPRGRAISGIRTVIEAALRLSIVVDAFASVPDFIKVPPLSRRKYERWVEGDAARLAELARRILYGALAAEDQVPSEEEVDIEAVRKYLGRGEHTASTSTDTWAFWDLVERLELKCEEIDRMPEMVEIREMRELFREAWKSGAVEQSASPSR